MHGIAVRYFKRLMPLMLLAVVILIAGIFWNDWQNQIANSTEIGRKNTESANNTLQTWIGDQINIVQTLAEDPRVINACSEPTNQAVVDVARIFLKSVNAKYTYYENIPLMVKLPPNVTVDVNVDGKITPLKSGQFFMDTVDNKTIGKGGEAARFIKEVFDGKPYFISHVYPSFLRGNPLFVVSAPVKRNGVVIGAVLIAPQMDYFTKRFINSVKIGQTGYMFMIDERGMVIAHPNKKNILNEAAVNSFKPLLEHVTAGHKIVTMDFEGTEKSYVIGKLEMDAKNVTHQWFIISAQDRAEIMAPSIQTAWTVGLFIAIVFGIIIFLIYQFTRKLILAPLGDTATHLEQMSNGDFSSEVNPGLLKRTDEFGKWAVALADMNANMRSMIRKVVQTAEHVAASSQEFTAVAQQSAEASTNIAASIQQVADGSQKQVGAVNDTSAIVQEISATMEEVSATADEMATLSEQTAKAAIEGKTSLDRAVNQMSAVSVGAKQAQVAAEELKISSKQIGEIVGLISTIAGQTNLLALNAAIEAARAGEQGRGFAVVAEEVRKLAEQSEQAAHQIKTLVSSNNASIGNVVDVIDVAIHDITQGVELVNVAGTNFGAINGQINQVTGQVHIIAKAINEAAIGSQRIVSSIKEVESISRDAAAEAQNVSAATEEQSASMEEIAASSQSLAKLANDLQLAVAKFRV